MRDREIGFDISIRDRKQGEMTGILFKDEEMDIPDQYLDTELRKECGKWGIDIYDLL